MRRLRYSINITLDGCVDHEAGLPDEELHRHHAANLERADALLFGRVTYQMMEEAWRRTPSGGWPEWMDDWMVPFAETIDGARKYVVSNTLDQVDWNAELVRGDLDLIDEYEFVVHPVIAGHGPSLLAGLPSSVTLDLVGREDFDSGAFAVRYRPRR